MTQLKKKLRPCPRRPTRLARTGRASRSERPIQHIIHFCADSLKELSIQSETGNAQTPLTRSRRKKMSRKRHSAHDQERNHQSREQQQERLSEKALNQYFMTSAKLQLAPINSICLVGGGRQICNMLQTRQKAFSRKSRNAPSSSNEKGMTNHQRL